jgi:4-hydroxybenzoate polyprenyltransferase
MEQFTSSTSQTVTYRVPSPLARFFSLFLLILFIVIAILIAIPLIIIAIVFAVVFICYIKIKQLFTRVHNPNGPLDGRHNVKVINRDE